MIEYAVRNTRDSDRVGLTIRTIVDVHSVRMPVGFGGDGLKTKGRQLSVMAHLKKSIIEVKAEENCLAHALIIAVGRRKIPITKHTGRDVKFTQWWTVY
jgi:hypothetical protein